MTKTASVTSKNCLLIFLFIGIFMIGFTCAVQAELMTNLALAGTASQSSFGWQYGEAYKAIDGNTDGNYFDWSVTHTSYESGAWWQVVLRNSYNIKQVVIWNRTDCCSERLSNFYVSILDANETVLWTQNYYINGGYPDPTLSINLLANTVGNIVKVGLNGANWLSLAEVQVFQNPVPVPPSLLLLAPGLLGLAGLRKRFCK
jgi:hypothetical protein